MKLERLFCRGVFKPVLGMAGVVLLASCELPPRETWGIIRRDGLINYWLNDTHAPYFSNRYLSSDGRPLRTGNAAVQIPYRPENQQTRYVSPRPHPSFPMQQESGPYRPRVTRSAPVVRQEPRVLQEPQAPKIPLDGGVKTAPSNPGVNTTAGKAAQDSLPYGIPIPGRPGMVNSPFAQKQQLVDVTGMAVGEAVKDPYSGKLFRVPPQPQAAAPWSPVAPTATLPPVPSPAAAPAPAPAPNKKP